MRVINNRESVFPIFLLVYKDPWVLKPDTKEREDGWVFEPNPKERKPKYDEPHKRNIIHHHLDHRVPLPSSDKDP